MLSTYNCLLDLLVYHVVGCVDGNFLLRPNMHLRPLFVLKCVGRSERWIPLQTTRYRGENAIEIDEDNSILVGPIF